jgi:archaellum biogenesis protein FlaJ (TadC family)
MFNIAHVIDVLVRSFLLFVAVFLIISYTIKDFILSIIISVLIIFFINLILEVIYRKKHKNDPKKSKEKIPIKTVLKQLFMRAFSRDKTKGYIYVGITVLIMNFFVKLNIYYITFASVVFILAGISRCGIIHCEDGKTNCEVAEKK